MIDVTLSKRRQNENEKPRGEETRKNKQYLHSNTRGRLYTIVQQTRLIHEYLKNKKYIYLYWTNNGHPIEFCPKNGLSDPLCGATRYVILCL